MIRTNGVPVALAMLLLIGSGCARFEARAELKKGNAAYRAGKFEAALTAYDNVPGGTPARIRASLNAGYSHMAQYRFGSKHPKDRAHAAEAVQFFEEYLSTRPEKEPDSPEFPSAENIDERGE